MKAAVRPAVIELDGWRFEVVAHGGQGAKLDEAVRGKVIAAALACARGEGDVIRRSRHATTTSASIERPGRAPLGVFIKLYERPPRSVVLKELFRGSRADHAARMSSALRARGFGVAPILITGLERDGGRTMIVTSRAEGAPLPAVIAAAAMPRKRAILRALGAEVGRLHRAGFIHGDLTPHNVFVVRDEPARFVFIDHDRTRRTHALIGARRRRLRNFVQLGRFALPGLTGTDRMRVLAAYARVMEIGDRHALAHRVVSMLRARLARDRIVAAPHTNCAADRAIGGLRRS
jgi:hypothetical protein